MKILTIIVSYNMERWMERCLGSLYRQEHPTDILVVDNASTDGTAELLHARHPRVRLVPNSTNMGFGQANNIGMQIALDEGYDAVFLLNQDAWIAPSTLDALSRMAAENPEFGILSPIHLNGSGTDLDHGFATYAHAESLAQLPAGSHLPVELPFVNAAFWFIPARVLRKVGLFSPLFYHYGEDVDYVNRLHYHGYKLGYCSGATGCHDREHRTASRAAWIRAESVYHLSEYTNVCHSFAAAFAYSILAAIKKSLADLLKGRMSDAKTHASIGLRLLLQTNEVRRYRHLNQKTYCL